MDSGQILLFQRNGGETKIEVRLPNESVWLSADQMAELFQRNKSTISRHVKNILESGELQRNSVVAENATTATDGKTYIVSYYNIDIIISVCYRVNSHREKLINHAGTVSAENARLKANEEYNKFRERTQYQLTPVEIHFIEAFEAEQKKLRGGKKQF